VKVPALLSRLIPARQKAAVDAMTVANSGGAFSWFGVVRESFAGAWQSVVQVDQPRELTSYSPVWACSTLAASDVAKLGVGLSVEDDKGICTPAPKNSPYWGVLRKPNHFQNWIQFIEHWVLSKLLWGNAYALKERDARGIVSALYILDPQRVEALVTPSGDVYYRLSTDLLAGVNSRIVVPAREIIHDRWNCLWHPLVGISPLYAAGMAATLGARIQRNSANFFANMSRPGGMLTAPATIDEETAQRVKGEFETNFTGPNIGRLFVAGDGLKFEPMAVTADAAQLAEQLNLTVVDVARAFHMPLFKIQAETGRNAGTLSIEAQQQAYLNDCLQIHITSIEVCLTQGLECPPGYKVEIDEDDMLRMDKSALYTALGEGVKAGIVAPNEGRKKVGLPPVKGGDTPYLQQQNFSLAALDKRDSQDNPFATAPAPTPAPTPEPEPTPTPAPTPAPQKSCAETTLEFMDDIVSCGKAMRPLIELTEAADA
jgi:HK97 family phage portal protein